MLKKFFSAMVLSIALVALAMPAARPALATPSTTIIQVNSTVDWPGESPGTGNCHTALASPAAGACTLRAAIMQADATSGEGATVIVPAGIYTLTISADVTDTANTGDVNLTTPVSGNPLISIVGAGASTTIIDANHLDRVLSVDTGRTAAISGFTLRGGFVSFSIGGGIVNSGTLTLDHTTISGNQGPNSDGGGFFNTGELTVIDSTIGPNNTAYSGGGIRNEGTLMLERSTLYGNSANYGGGIFNTYTNTIALINSTISENNVVKDGGGIWNNGLANVYNSTIVFNGADTGQDATGSAGGVFNNHAGTFNMRNTLLAGNNVGNTQVYDDCTGTLHSYGRNVFGTLNLCTIDTPAGGGWIYLNSLDFIGPLQNNGGPTWTHALLAGNNAIDWGEVNGCVDATSLLATDQRGFARVVGPSCDTGAFEAGLPTYLPAIQR